MLGQAFFFFFLPMTWFPVNSKGCLSVCLLPWGGSTDCHRQVVHLWGFCAAWGYLLWGLLFKLDTSWSCVLLNFWWEEAECLREGVLLPNSHKASSWDGLALWLGCDNCFLTLWKRDRRQVVLKKFDEAVAKKTPQKTGIKSGCGSGETDGWVWVVQKACGQSLRVWGAVVAPWGERNADV